jgi:ABC-type uncharacterized transport system substrate-binding protein
MRIAIAACVIASSMRWAMKRAAILSILVVAVLLAVGVMAEAQQPARIPRIGYLSGNSLSASPARTEAFRQGLRELGYVEGKNIVIEWRSAEGNYDLLPALAAELVNLKVDVILSYGPIPTRAAKKATTTIPIVMAFDSDPVGSGMISSLARPGGNITGLSTLAPEISGKQLEILKEIEPKLSRVAVFGNNDEPGNAQNLKEVELAAKAFGIKVSYLNIQSVKDIEGGFRAAKKAHAEAVISLTNPILTAHRSEIAKLAVKHRLPATYNFSSFVEDGGLMFYGPDVVDLSRRAATYVDNILKGRKPADLPVEQPKKFEFVVNLKAAKQIGLTIPPNVLARADRVIK